MQFCLNFEPNYYEKYLGYNLQILITYAPYRTHNMSNIIVYCTAKMQLACKYEEKTEKQISGPNTKKNIFDFSRILRRCTPSHVLLALSSKTCCITLFVERLQRERGALSTWLSMMYVVIVTSLRFV